MNPPLKAALAACGLLLALARGEQRPAHVVQPGSAAHGREIYETAGCAVCHAATLLVGARSEPIYAGHPLEGAPYRGSWWNGRITTDVGEASDFCLRTFVDPNSPGFTAEERKALVLFMQGLGSQRGVSPLVLLRRDAGDVHVGSGDPGRGRELYRRACGACHGEGRAAEQALVKDLSPTQVAEIIRKGKGTMPFFQIDLLTSSHVADIAAYLDSVKASR